MMDQEKWTLLRETFDNEANFGEEGWYSANEGYPPFDLMEWLECSTVRPSLKMVEIFQDHGYDVYPAERDSFGWLIGVVKDRTTKRRISFG